MERDFWYIFLGALPFGSSAGYVFFCGYRKLNPSEEERRYNRYGPVNGLVAQLGGLASSIKQHVGGGGRKLKSSLSRFSERTKKRSLKI